MARIKNQNEIILSRLERLRLLQPNLDAKPGTIARDLLIENPSIELASLYSDLGAVQNSSSISNSLGADLEKWGSNFKNPRVKIKPAAGPALLLFSSLEADIAIRAGDLVYAKNGASFKILTSLNLSPVNINKYKATANRYRADLDFLGLTESMAIEVLTEATSPGVSGNISKYFLNRSSIFGITNVTNVQPFGGGTPSESDNVYRNRILSSLNGSVAGGEIGYQNAILSDPDVSDAVVIVPGDVLMTRDGTVVETKEDGTKSIISEGTGGKVDIYVLGSRIQESSDSFIYRDKSNTKLAENEKNNFVLGQISGDENKTVSRRRMENLSSGILPLQPITNLISVSGSASGPNFQPKKVDEYGRITGNYELLKDSGEFGGSSWGFDALHWVSSEIKNYPEDKTKGLFNGQDDLSFSGLKEVVSIQQNISVTNEVPKLLSDRSVLQLTHFPISSVTRVVNSTTGERYNIIDQNIDSLSGLNQTGKIKISGKTLPIASDTLQVDYIWVYDYNPYFDFDNIKNSFNLRTTDDSIDWGYNNLIRYEPSKVLLENGRLTAAVTHAISSVLSVVNFVSETSDVTFVSNRLAIVLTNEILNVQSIKKISSGVEVWSSTGTFKNKVIFLPPEIEFTSGEILSVQYNTENFYSGDTVGSFQGNKIYLSSGSDGYNVLCTYIADLSSLVSNITLEQLPLIRDKNYLINKNNLTVGFQPTTNYFANSEQIQNLRKSPSNLECSLSGSFSPFTLSFSGTTVNTIKNHVFVVPFSGLKLDLSGAIRKILQLPSTGVIPKNLFISRLISVQRVTTANDLTVLSVDKEYDLIGYKLLNNSFALSEAEKDINLKPTEILLSSSENNISFSPVVGQTLQITFCYSYFDDLESINILRAGKLITQKKFSEINTVFISSGALKSASLQSTLTINALNQPTSRSRYKVRYSYQAPKQNERITVNFNYEKLIGDNVLQIEKSRPPGSDILIKSATPILVDVTLKIVVTQDVIDRQSSSVILQNVQDAVTNAMSTKLGGIVDSSDLLYIAANVSGVDRVQIVYFNRNNQIGSVLSIKAEKNEYLVPNDVQVSLETR